MDFLKFRNAVNANIDEMVKGDVFEVETLSDLREVYLNAFPQGSNPIHKERGTYDCTCCKSFIKNMGGLVSVKGNSRKTIWDFDLDDDFQIVADTLREYVMQQPITGLFMSNIANISSKISRQKLDDNSIKTWDHFYYNLPDKLVTSGDTWRSNMQADFDVLKRSIEEISLDSTDTVLDLISDKSIYRGDEHKVQVQKLQKILKQNQKETLTTDQIWVLSAKLKGAGRFKNSVIGTLLHDLSSGTDLTAAVKKFESKVAPQNYKRSKALVTQKMIDNAEKKIEELGIEEALSRRFAVETDITVNNVLFADRKSKIKGALGGLKPTKAVKSTDKVEPIVIDDFLNNVLPKTSKVEAFFDNKHSGNLVSLIAPENQDAPNILKWDNNFSWTYNGDITDSMRERVVQAGGRVDGVLRFTHSWNHNGGNNSLMDLHVFMPKCGYKQSTKKEVHDNYPSGQRVGWNNRTDYTSGGTQDVDYTSEAKKDFIPIENITFPKLDKLIDGEYHMKIHNWNKRSRNTEGFQAEIEFQGELYQYYYPDALKHKEWVDVAIVTLKKGKFTIEHQLPCGQQSKDIWGVDTEQWVEVVSVMKSPNYWDNQEIGNQHTFFMLKDCKNPDQARGLYNEFLNGEMNEHRKVFELLGSKLKTPESDNQLSGLGFSSTKETTVKCKADGRVYEITF